MFWESSTNHKLKFDFHQENHPGQSKKKKNVRTF